MLHKQQQSTRYLNYFGFLIKLYGNHVKFAQNHKTKVSDEVRKTVVGPFPDWGTAIL